MISGAYVHLSTLVLLFIAAPVIFVEVLEALDQISLLIDLNTVTQGWPETTIHRQTLILSDLNLPKRENTHAYPSNLILSNLRKVSPLFFCILWNIMNFPGPGAVAFHGILGMRLLHPFRPVSLQGVSSPGCAAQAVQLGTAAAPAHGGRLDPGTCR